MITISITQLLIILYIIGIIISFLIIFPAYMLSGKNELLIELFLYSIFWPFLIVKWIINIGQ